MVALRRAQHRKIWGLTMTMKLLAAVAAVICLSGEAAAAETPAYGAWGVDLAGMDPSVKPGDDFFDYTNGKWYAAAVLPADRPATGAFDDLQILSEKRMSAIVAELEAKPYEQLSDEEKKLRDLYDAFTDTAAIEKRGLAPAKRDLARIAALKTLPDVARPMGDPSRAGESLFGAFVGANPRTSNQYVSIVLQAGLGMPDRDYYLKDDPALAAARAAYKTYLATMLTMSGAKNAEARAAAVFDLETAIAKAHWAAADRRDANKTYNPMTIAELDAYAPGFPWDDFFAALGISATGPDRKST